MSCGIINVRVSLDIDIQSYPIRPDEVNDWNCAAHSNMGQHCFTLTNNEMKLTMVNGVLTIDSKPVETVIFNDGTTMKFPVNDSNVIDMETNSVNTTDHLFKRFLQRNLNNTEKTLPNSLLKIFNMPKCAFHLIEYDKTCPKCDEEIKNAQNEQPKFTCATGKCTEQCNMCKDTDIMTNAIMSRI